jgi:hemoglobin
MQMFDPIGALHKSVGDAPFFALVEEFYKRVAEDPILRPMYPADLSQSKEHLALFLIQRTGGPDTYSQKQGHPKMRARHLPFKIGQKERDAWMTHMTAALDCVPELAPSKKALWDFFDNFATFMINQPN